MEPGTPPGLSAAAVAYAVVMSAPTRLLIKDYARGAAHGHFGRSAKPWNPRNPLHCHDFPEVCWITGGEGWQLHPEGRTPLKPGTLLLVRPEDSHGFTASAPGGVLRLANLAVSAATWAELVARYREDPLARPYAERAIMLTAPMLAELDRAALDLDRGRVDRLAVEQVLIHVWGALRRIEASQPETPEWLRAACAALQAPARFRAGTAAFVAAAGHSPEHVARAARRFLGRTPTDLVNEARLAHAARLLAEDPRDIAAIALDCGLANLGHFYRLFRRQFGVTPAEYRRRQRRIVGG